jgi:predicted dehydrogenase
MDTHKVGIVGLGWPGERHAEGIQRCGLGHLYGACDLNEARRTKFPLMVFGIESIKVATATAKA